MAESTLLMTMTGEVTQFVRLHYRFASRSKLIAAFRKLRCLDYDPDQKRWVWQYKHEAKRLTFHTPYAQIDPAVQPLVLGSFFFRDDDHLVLDLRSVARALVAVPFFNTQIPRKILRVEDVEIQNRLHTAEHLPSPLTPTAIFDRQVTPRFDEVAFLRKIEEAGLKIEDMDERRRFVMQAFLDRSSRPIPEFERFATHFYEEGIDSMMMALRLRQIVATEHWRGNLDFTLADASTLIAGRLLDDEDDWDDDEEEEDWVLEKDEAEDQFQPPQGGSEPT